MNNTKILKMFLAMLPVVVALGLAPSIASAHDAGFVHNASGTFTTTGSGGCLHTPRWTPAMGECGVNDSDGDGVNDDKDKCPGTPAGVKVDAQGCGIDSDGDGVADYEDKCPGTPRGTRVNTSGCPLKITVGGVHFDFDKASLKDSAKGVLDGAAGQLQGASAVAVTGYADSTGPAAYNQALSERRANTVKSYLEGKGVKGITASGAGEANPVGDNSTRAGRAANRRVEIDVKM